MVNREFFQALDELERGGKVSKQLLIESLEAGLASAYKKEYGESREITVRLNEEKQSIKVYAHRLVVAEVEDEESQISLEDAREIKPSYKEGDVVIEDITPKEFSRIAAQTAKQVIMQRINDARKEYVLSEMSERQGEILNAVVRRKEGTTVYVEISGSQMEGVMMQNDQVRGETYNIGDVIKVYIKKIRDSRGTAQVVVSRSSAGFVRRLFEMEVPEIKAGLVKIMSIAREGGFRTKIAVYSEDPNVDAVGACIGNKGVRVNAVVAELAGEKVDVIEELLREEEEDESKLVPRPPVVCVMGHVDHGKTSLLDCIRKTHVTDREAGGITQHIGAYMVDINGQKITFLDTPGHEAFTAMRMRGANATDIAVLVVAADDGVMPQTIEAINHAKAAGVEIIVAINKIDKPSANVERVKQELSEYELIPEDWGGSTIFVPVSAHTGEGIDTLLEMILLTAEVAELKANPNRRARGLVIEAKLDKGKGSVATILVQKGTLHVGDFIAAGACSGKVRAMIDDKGRKVKEAGPSTPVEILGLNDVPNAGEILVVTENDKEAKHFAATFVSENKNRLLEETKSKMSLDDLFSQIQAGNLKELPIIVKADVQGSVEAVKQSLVKLSNDEVVVKVIHGGVGAINESDVSLASASNAIIIGFNVRPDATAKSIAEQEGVDLRLYRVIYQAIEDVEAAMKGMLDPVYEEKVIGHAEIRQIFKASGVGNIAGSYVTDGIFQRNCKVRISREGEQIYEGELASLKRFKDDVKEVKAGYECGLVFEGFNDIKEEDQVEAYIMVEVPR